MYRSTHGFPRTTGAVRRFFPIAPLVVSAAVSPLSPVLTAIRGLSSVGGHSGDRHPPPEQQRALEIALGHMIDRRARPRRPLSPAQLLLPSYLPAAHPVLLGASSTELSQCSDGGYIADQLRSAAQRNGFYSPVWVSEAAIARHELQLRGVQSGTAVGGIGCGTRLVPLAALRDGALIDYIGSLVYSKGGRASTAGRSLSTLCGERTITRIIAPRGNAKFPAVGFTVSPPHLSELTSRQAEVFSKAMHSLSDSAQFLVSSPSGRKWAEGQWIGVADAITFHAWWQASSGAANGGGSGRRAVDFGDLMDASAFLQRHVSPSGRKASFRLGAGMGVYYNSEQFTDNKMLINLTKTVIMENLRAVAGHRQQQQHEAGEAADGDDTPPVRVGGRLVDATNDAVVQRMLAEQRAAEAGDGGRGVARISVPNDDLNALAAAWDGAQRDEDARLRGRGAGLSGDASLVSDFAAMAEELRASRLRYTSHSQRANEASPQEQSSLSAAAAVGHTSDSVTARGEPIHPRQPNAYIGDATTEADFAAANEATASAWPEGDEAPKSEEIACATAHPTQSESLGGRSSSNGSLCVMTQQQWRDGLKFPLAADDAAFEDIAACRDFSADESEATHFEEESGLRVAVPFVLAPIVPVEMRGSADAAWLVDPLPAGSAEQLDMACNEEAFATRELDEGAWSEGAACSRVEEASQHLGFVECVNGDAECKASRMDLASIRDLRADDELFEGDVALGPISVPPLPVSAPRTDMSPRAMFAEATCRASSSSEGPSRGERSRKRTAKPAAQPLPRVTARREARRVASPKA